MFQSVNSAGVVPASLSFFAIYNPSLGQVDETLHNQIVYYHRSPQNARKSGKITGGARFEDTQDERNEKLRQIGLAQGMVEFAKSFSHGEPVDSIETEKSRIILHELEKDWWILVSINLTRLPNQSETTSQTKNEKTVVPIEFSAREVCPPALLLQQILRAHQIFLLHHASNLAELYIRVSRPKFCTFLKRFWDGFIGNWDVLLHGNPAVDIFNGLKLAAGGELGIGVGEEDWGSGEREVFEAFIGRSEGLVDLIVSRFGDVQSEDQTSSVNTSSIPQAINKGWENAGALPTSSDGVIFSGTGALSRASVRNISSWMEWLYMYGKDAYGVRENPSSRNRRKNRPVKAPKPEKPLSDKVVGKQKEGLRSRPSPSYNGQAHLPTGIPGPIVPRENSGLDQIASWKPGGGKGATTEEQDSTGTTAADPSSGTETFMKYLTLGVYGSAWGIPSGRPAAHTRVSSVRGEKGSGKQQTVVPNNRKEADEEGSSRGYFLIGLQGDLEEDMQRGDEEQGAEPGTDNESLQGVGNNSNSRVLMRTLYVERTLKAKGGLINDDDLNAYTVDSMRVRVVVYVQRPFVFTFLYELRTDALAITSFYRSLHHQLGPLQRPLLASTSPRKISERLWESAVPKSTASTNNTQPIYDLVYDPSRLTVHTTVPNIPEPGPGPDERTKTENLQWSRVEALSVHSQILNTYGSTRGQSPEVERTCKTSRGWWVVWMRLPHGTVTQRSCSDVYSEAFLIRKASDYVPSAVRKSSLRFGREVSGLNESRGWGPGKLAEGIGIDARQYIESILSLNR